ncbi:MAG: hypothetical protein M1826_001236 [Phylliscum demangeonii]|nr:MAG: hypothetical protein M1826_001236 [Phylliscum demangeonii]
MDSSDDGPWPPRECSPELIWDRTFGLSWLDCWETIEGSPTARREAETNRLAADVASGKFDLASHPWLTFLRSRQAFAIPLSNGDLGIRVMYVHRDDLERMRLPEVVGELDELMAHVRGCGNGQVVHDGFATYQPSMVGNRDGPTTAFSTSFIAAGHYLVAPVAHSVCANVSWHTGTEAEKNDFQQAQQAWLRRFNRLAGDLAGRLIRGLLPSDYVEMLDARADLTNPPCPGRTPNLNRFLTSIQVNCSTPATPVGGTAGDTHRDSGDEPFSFSVAINASVVRDSTELNFLLFPVLGVAIPVCPGGIAIFSGVEYHRAMPMVTAAHDSTPIPLGYPQETRLQIILYPKLGILNSQLERCTPDTPHERWDRDTASRYNLVDHGIVAFGSAEACDLWIRKEGLRAYVNHLQRQQHLKTTIDSDLLHVVRAQPWLHPGRCPVFYRWPELVMNAQHRARFIETLSQLLQVLRQTSAGLALQPIDAIGRLSRKRPRPNDDDNDDAEESTVAETDDANDAEETDAENNHDNNHDNCSSSLRRSRASARITQDYVRQYLRAQHLVGQASLVTTESALAALPHNTSQPSWSTLTASTPSSQPASDTPFSILLTGFSTIVSALTEGTSNMETGVRRTVAHILIRAMDLWTQWNLARPVLIHEPDRLHPHDQSLVLAVRHALVEDSNRRTRTATGWRYRISLPATIDVDWDGAEPLDASTADARLPQILDQVLWAIAMAPGLQWVKRRVELTSQPEPLPSTEPPVVSISRPMSRSRREEILQIAALGAMLRAFGETFPGQTMGLLMTSAFVHLIFHVLASLAETGRYAHAVIDRVAEVLIDPGLEFRARLDVCAHQWAAVEPGRPSPLHWIRLVEASPGHVALAAPRPVDEAAADALIARMRTIMEAGKHALNNVESLHLDTAVEAYVARFLRGTSPVIRDKHQPFRRSGPSFIEAYACCSPAGDVRLRLSRWIAARCFGWGRPQLLSRILAIADLDALWAEQDVPAFWHPPVYGRLHWPAAERDVVRQQLGGLIDLLVERLALTNTAPDRPMPFADVLALFQRPGTRCARVPRLPAHGLVPWLIASDLSTLFPGHVARPEVGDLARKIGTAASKHGGGQGPWEAFRLLHPAWVAPGHLPSLSEVRERLDDLQQRLTATCSAFFPLFDAERPAEISWIDVEHVLCKVTRETT